MKIGQSYSPPPSLIERMQKAHAEGKESASKASFEAPAARAEEVKTSSPLQRSVLGIAEKVMTGKVANEHDARREVLGAIVEQRYGDMVPPTQKRQAVQALEITLLDDPAFCQEVDQMLVLAARELTATGRG